MLVKRIWMNLEKTANYVKSFPIMNLQKNFEFVEVCKSEDNNCMW